MPDVVYDGGCGFCTVFKRWMERLDWLGRLEWVDLHEADYSDLPVAEEQCVEAMQFIQGGRVHSGFYAARKVLISSPLTLPIGLVMYVPGVPFLGTKVYRWVAGKRHCTV